MGEIYIISAIAENNCIGVKGKIPWYIPEDFQHFRRETEGYPCIMGDVTYASLPDNARPLPNRENIVLSIDPNYKNPDAKVFNDIPKAIEYAKSRSEKIFICGGGTIYRLTMKYADKMMITRVHKVFDGDAFFPEIKDEEWVLESESEMKTDKKSGLNYTFQLYKRRKK